MIDERRSDGTEERGILAAPITRAAIGAIVGGPVGVVTALATGGPLVLTTGLLVIAGAMLGALTAEGADAREAAIDALLPVGVWLVGAAVGWVVLSTFREDLPSPVGEHIALSALAAAVLGGTLATVVLIFRLGKSAE
ncbi:MAG: hypothetical protein ACLFU7_00905 [Armatimonadota bacterium]